ncbi:MAG: hypothetical protein ACYCV7_09120 [Acidimicrobiales bacterium]
MSGRDVGIEDGNQPIVAAIRAALRHRTLTGIALSLLVVGVW